VNFSVDFSVNAYKIFKMHIEHLRTHAPAHSTLPAPKKQWPTALLIIVLCLGIGWGTHSALKAGQKRSDKVFHSLVLDGIDGGLKTVLPGFAYQITHRVMTVYLKPAEQIKRAQAVLNKAPVTTHGGVKAKQATNQFLF
jgi:hypothetical protein